MCMEFGQWQKTQLEKETSQSLQIFVDLVKDWELIPNPKWGAIH